MLRDAKVGDRVIYRNGKSEVILVITGSKSFSRFYQYVIRTEHHKFNYSSEGLLYKDATDGYDIIDVIHNDPSVEEKNRLKFKIIF